MSIISFLSEIGLLGKNAYLRERAHLVKRVLIDRPAPKPANTSIHICPVAFMSSAEAFCGAKRGDDAVEAAFERHGHGVATWRIDSFYCGSYGVDPDRVREWACPDCLKVLDAVATFDPRPIEIWSAV